MVEAKLGHSLGLNLITLNGFGNILWAGIYLLIRKIASSAGFYTPLAFLIARW